MRKHKSKIFKISVDLYRVDIVVALGSTRDEILRYVERKDIYVSKEAEKLIVMNGQGRSVSERTFKLLWINSSVLKGEVLGTLVHETIHIADAIFNFAGVEPDLDNDETYAYLVEHIFNSVISKK